MKAIKRLATLRNVCAPQLTAVDLDLRKYVDETTDAERRAVSKEMLRADVDNDALIELLCDCLCGHIRFGAYDT
ncbi:MAG: hypothetical protein MUC68_01430 [Burkholderiaceae bacterium]|nr:hypothetical protein [Burkholderiaceae bacterium]